MLVLSLMSECDNNCLFCCVRDERVSAKVIPLSDLKIQISSVPSCTIIDFFGGEPTLYPWFFEALTFARSQGHPCRIATNGRNFSDKDFTRKVVDLGIESIRTSLYGPSPVIHDFHTRRINSFDQTIQGIKNLVELNIDLIVNIVITEKNYQFLAKMVDLLNSLGVKRIKFGSLVNSETCLHLVPNNKLVQPNLINALETCVKYEIEYAVEKSALCLAPKFNREFAYEPDSSIYTKSEKCRPCLVSENCVGIPQEQLMLFGDEVVEPIIDNSLKHPDSDLLIGTDPQFIRWDDLSNQSITTIIKLSSLCNLDCTYCYARRNFTNKLMPMETAYQIIDKLAETNFGRIDLNFHGGEPLLYNKDDLQRLIQYSNQKLVDKTTVHRIQSNGTLVDVSWGEFFSNVDLEIGISLDGPREIHDENRVLRNNAGSHSQTIKGLEILSNFKQEYEILCVLTPASDGKSHEIMDFFINLLRQHPQSLISVNLSPSFEVDEFGRVLPTTIMPDVYSRLMLQLFDEWVNYENDELSIPFFEQIMTILLGGEATMCQFKRGCGQFLTIEPDGGVYPCDRFSGIDDFYLGNINHDSFEEIITSQNHKKYINLANNFSDDCMKCKWFTLCNGGCLYESIASAKSRSNQSFYCSALQEIFSHIDNFLKVNDEDYKPVPFTAGNKSQIEGL